MSAGLVTSVVIAKSEGYPLIPATAPDFSSAAAEEIAEHVAVAAGSDEENGGVAV